MTEMRKTYEVTAKRWKHGWELDIDDLGVTQSTSLSGAEKMVRDYIALDLDVAEDSFDVVFRLELDNPLGAMIDIARKSVAAAAEAQLAAANASRQVVHRLKDEGLSGQDVAIVLGVSPQRVSQLAAAPRPAKSTQLDEIDILGAGMRADIQGIEDAVATFKARSARRGAKQARRTATRSTSKKASEN